jgi:hypothetical protein
MAVGGRQQNLDPYHKRVVKGVSDNTHKIKSTQGSSEKQRKRVGYVGLSWENIERA